jgi:two-component system invasion response regulator UvrY
MQKDIYKIIIADDHAIVRSGLDFLIQQQPHMKIVAEAPSFSALMTILEGETCDLLILDLNMGDKNGLQSIKEINGLYPDMPILVLSMYPEELYAVQSIKAGASGYLNKKAVSEELTEAIKTIASGKKYVSESVQGTLLYGVPLEKESQNPAKLLSKREFEVLTLIAAGMTYKDISDKLSLSPKTVSTYRTRILEKLSLDNTSQLIHFALQNDIVA